MSDQILHPNCPFLPGPKTRSGVHGDGWSIRGIDGEHQPLALVLRGQPLGMLREFAAEALLAESRSDADVDQFHRAMGRMAGQEQTAGGARRGIGQEVFQNEPAIGAKFADLLITEDDVERAAKTIERRAILGADVGFVDDSCQFRFPSRLERTEEKTGKIRSRGGKVIRLTSHVKEVCGMLITRLGEGGGCLFLAFRQKGLAKVGIPARQFVLDAGEKLPRDNRVGLTAGKLWWPKRGGFAGNLLGENCADKFIASGGGHEQKAAVMGERQEAQRFQLGRSLGFRPALHGES